MRNNDQIELETQEETNGMRIIRYYLHGILFAFITPISAYITHLDARTHADPASVWGVVIVSIIFYLFSAFMFFILTRDHLSAGMVGTFAVLGILYTREIFLPIIATILFAWLLLAIVSRRIDITHPYVASTIISVVITIYFGMKFALFVHGVNWDKEKSMAIPVEITVPASTIRIRPDIYYIILDAYGAEEMLNKLHGFDNSEFTSALKERGFILPPEAKSNFTRTIHSLSSSLNMQYLDNMEKIMGDSYPWWHFKGTFWKNETREFLESQGYQTVAIASGWGLTTMTDTDVYKQPYPIFLDEFGEFFIQNTNLSLFGFLGDHGVSFPSYDTHRQIVQYEFEQLKEIPGLASPKFTFVHIISPHPPFVFDAEGDPINPDYPFTIADNRYLITPPSKYQRDYLNQMTFINTQIIEVVDTILEKSVAQPIIIIQGDHGPGIFVDYQSASPPCFYERYSILNAYYLPGIDTKTVPQDITPVNTFRMIFNQYFSADLEILPNRQYFSLPETVHQFEDVTDRIDDACVFPDGNK
jgi:hypothetical protein